MSNFRYGSSINMDRGNSVYLAMDFITRFLNIKEPYFYINGESSIEANGKRNIIIYSDSYGITEIKKSGKCNIYNIKDKILCKKEIDNIVFEIWYDPIFNK